MNLFKNMFNMILSFTIFNNENYSIHNAPNILYLYKNLNTTNIYNISQPQISCHKLIKDCPKEVIIIREPGILEHEITKWNCYYDSIANNTSVLWKSDCIVSVEIFNNNKINVDSFQVNLIPLLRYEILFLHIIGVLMIMHLLLRPFKNNLFYRSLNDILFFICGYIIGSDSSYFSMNLFKTGNMILHNYTKY